MTQSSYVAKEVNLYTSLSQVCQLTHTRHFYQRRVDIWQIIYSKYSVSLLFHYEKTLSRNIMCEHISLILQDARKLLIHI
jgi:hypothetical protein